MFDVRSWRGGGIVNNAVSSWKTVDPSASWSQARARALSGSFSSAESGLEGTPTQKPRQPEKKSAHPPKSVADMALDRQEPSETISR